MYRPSAEEAQQRHQADRIHIAIGQAKIPGRASHDHRTANPVPRGWPVPRSVGKQMEPSSAANFT
jgi:hypothetical protein